VDRGLQVRCVIPRVKWLLAMALESADGVGDRSPPTARMIYAMYDGIFCGIFGGASGSVVLEHRRRLDSCRTRR
jgi:hypothetical protein